MVIHGTSVDAVQAQLGLEVVTSTDLSAFPAPTESVLTDSVTEHVGGGGASWLTVTVWRATVSVPERELESGLAAIPIGTVPLPVPLVAPVSVSHESFDVAVQGHVDVVVTSTLDEPASEPAGMVNGATVYEQLGGRAAAWSTVTVWPAIVRVPERGDVLVFSAIENDTVALPVPLAAPVSLSQGTFTTAVHAHEDAVVMSTLLEPAAAGADTLVDDSEYEQVTDAAA
jgi:hypothetical protein